MSQAKVALHKHRRKGLPVLGAAGLSLWLSGGAAASTDVTTTDIPTFSVAVDQEQTLREEEITDITLSTFHIFDGEGPPRLLRRIAAGACGACGSGFYDQPASNAPMRSISPPQRKSAHPYVQTLKRPQERPQERPQARPQVPKHQEQNVGGNQREAGTRAVDQNATRQAQPELDGLVINQSAGQQAQPQMATPVPNSAN
jgi:hypothetical protein